MLVALTFAHQVQYRQETLDERAVECAALAAVPAVARSFGVKGARGSCGDRRRPRRAAREACAIQRRMLIQGRMLIGPLLAALLAAVVLATISPAQATATPRSCVGSVRWLMRFDESRAAAARHALVVYRTPSRRAGRARFPKYGAYGIQTVFAVLAERLDASCRPSWLRVKLPIVPNGSSGWVQTKDVKLSKLTKRIVVDVSQRRLYLYRRGRIVFSSPAAVGKASTPTPLGRFYVNQRLIPADQRGAYGPRALGVAAHSTVLHSWRDGGPVGIHGTNERFSIGQPVSHGCIRLPNTAILRLFRLTPLGTPVNVRR
jgi:lipoprotein-anchoring transpeptidase ErfK/SrfK